ncbi:amidohydrolase family protein [Aquicoccus sp. SCR17]|nr:amidohydrolase family protein [Carideicomes alvinocaridis]
MLAIDSHAHIWGHGFVPPAFFRAAAEGWAAKEESRRPEMIMPKLLEGIVDPDGDDFVANMDRAGIDASMIMMIDVGGPVFGEEPETPPEAQIEFYAELQRRHAGRLFCHVSVDAARPDHLDLTRRALRDHGLRGIGEITPNGFSAADPSIRPMLEIAADEGVPVQVHTRAGVWTDMDGSDLTEGNPVHPLHVARLARELPELRIILCHAGFPHWWQVAAEAVADLPNCMLDISNWNEVFRGAEAEMIARLATWRGIVGAERLLFASDQPSGPRFTGTRSHLGEWADFIRALPENAARHGYRFTPEEAAAIMGGNAARLYRIEEE